MDDRFTPKFIFSYPGKGAKNLKVQVLLQTKGGLRCRSGWRRNCSIFIIYFKILDLEI
jgi:hypothetical protein